MKTLSTHQAAALLDVSPSTVKRWVDRGFLRARKTAGGHRRIPEAELARFDPAGASGVDADDWLELLADPDPLAAQALLLAKRARSGAWWRVAEDACAGLAEIGRLWQTGSCRVSEEHLFSEALRRAAAACAAAIPLAPQAPRVLLLSAAGERHLLGLSLAEPALAEAGWRGVFVGEGPPAEELDGLLGRVEAERVVAVASVVRRAPGLAAYAEPLSAACRVHSARLALAGGGPWPRIENAARLAEWRQLSPWLEEG